MRYMRDDLADEYGILSLQDKILQIAIYIDEICEKHGIDYCLMGGSALGAIRHGGFIPWDDDLDIFMKPSEYEKFRAVFANEGNHKDYYLQELMERQGLVASAKLRLNHTMYVEEATKDMKIHQGIFVDIFILHNTANSGLFRAFHCLNAKCLLAKGQSFKNIKYRGIKRVFIGLFKLLPKEWGIARRLKRIYQYDKKESKYVCHFMGKAFFEKGVYSASIFSSTKRVPFEKVELRVPSKSDEYLTKRFGDYMSMPSKDSIHSAQHACLWKTEADCNAPNGIYSDEKYLI